MVQLASLDPTSPYPKNFQARREKVELIFGRNELFMLEWSKQKGVNSTQMAPFFSFALSAEIAENLSVPFSTPNFCW